MSEITEIKARGALEELRRELLDEAYRCLECGKCTGSCPMVQLFPGDFHPHHLLTDLIHNPDNALKGANLWFCASCYKCNKRCPQAIEFPYIVMKMRTLALRENGMESLQEAFEKIRQSIPFPLSFLSVCIHPERIGLDPAILADMHKENLSRSFADDFPVPGPKVAVVGSGPAGLMTAYELRKMGYGVTIFESESVPGGMFSLAIPEYRLPLQIVLDEIQNLQKTGIELRINARIGKDHPVQKLLDEGFEAVILAVGAHQCKSLEITGEDFEGVYTTLEFLREVKTQKKNVMDKRVVVIGGGNTAMDSASVAARNGAKEVSLLYRRTRDEMPADINEIRETEQDGVKMRFLESPLSIHGEKSKVNMLECIKMELGEPDLSGRRVPVPVEGSNFSMEADIVVVAIGEQPGIEDFEEEIAVGGTRTLLVNPFTMETSQPGVFAAGDSISGPATVADAILGARKAAIGIDTKIKES